MKARDRISRRILNQKRTEQEKSNKNSVFYLGSKVRKKKIYMRVIGFWQRVSKRNKKSVSEKVMVIDICMRGRAT